MTILALLALISFIGMLALIAPKILLVRREEVVHNSHIGLRDVMRPFVQNVQTLFMRLWAKIWAKIAPFAQFVVYKAGSWIHEASVRLAKKLLSIAARIQGRQALRERKEESAFSEGMVPRRRV